MKIQTTKSFSATASASKGLIVVGFYQDGKLSPLAKEWNEKNKDLLKKTIVSEELKGSVGECRSFTLVEAGQKTQLLMVGLGKKEKVDAEAFRKFAASVIKVAMKLKVESLALEDVESDAVSAEERGHSLVEGLILASYSYDALKKEKKKNSVKDVFIVTQHEKGVRRGIEKGEIFAQATCQARDWVNTPANLMTPRDMVSNARRIAKLPRLELKVLEEKQLRTLGMGSYLAVSQGSDEPPYFIHLHYQPAQKTKKKIVIIGKGVTFDSGGLSIKPAQGMETMKDDMSGSAAIISVMEALALLKLPIEVHGLAAMTENMPSGKAIRPGDVVTAMNGKSIEILNTDAEGRLTLADAVCYAQTLKPDLVLDIATLTGACVVALGELCSAIYGNRQEWVDRVIASGKQAGERLWQMPLIDEYREEIKSPVADVKNIGGRFGGSINGALFIQEFIEESTPWVHVDIAGPSWTDKDLAYAPRGGTGHMVRTLLHFIENLC